MRARDKAVRRAACLFAAALLWASGPAQTAGDSPPHVLLIAVDDMGYDTPVSFGGQVAGLTPRIDTLASRGTSFTRAFNTSSRCAPSRGSIMTGLYQDGYSEEPGSSDTTVRAAVRTLPEHLREKGYLTGLFGKDTHYRPLEKYAFDEVAPMAAMAVGRSPELYARNVAAFIDRAVAAGRPFFISANTHDPHRPYADAPGEREALKRRFEKEVEKLELQPEFLLPPDVKAYSGRNLEAPGFIPDHPLVREEFGYYLNSSHRADRFVGALMDVLEAKGVLENTLVIFHSDNGMHWPFAKSNVYVASVKTPLVIYWPGHSRAGEASDSLVSTIDILPTILDAADIDVPAELPGKSLLPLLADPSRRQHERVFATINAKGDTRFEMRSVIDAEHIYIYNKWADGETRYHGGRYPGGMALEGFEAAAEHDEAARRRLDFFYLRAKEELYDLRRDPNALANLVERESAAPILDAMRQSMLRQLAVAGDPYVDDYRAFLETVGHRSEPRPVLAMDFESHAGDRLQERLLQHGKLTLAPGDGVGGGTGLRAEYTGYERGSERIVRHLPLPRPGPEFSLNYDVRFDEDFQFVQGGKLLGLGPVNHVTGGRPIVPDGWSVRVTFKQGGAVRLYVYHQDMEGQYGDRGERVDPIHFERGRWHPVSLHVRVNDSPAAANGFARLYVDGRLVERREKLRLRGSGGDDTMVNKFMFSSFHGGHRPRNAPRDENGNYTTVYALFDNIEVHEGEHIRRTIGTRRTQ